MQKSAQISLVRYDECISTGIFRGLNNRPDRLRNTDKLSINCARDTKKEREAKDMPKNTYIHTYGLMDLHTYGHSSY